MRTRIGTGMLSLALAVGFLVAIPAGPAAAATTNTAYVTNNVSNTVTPIDIAAGTAGTTIGVGTGPWGIAITPDGKTAYVVNNGSANVTPINTANNTAGTPIGVGSSPLDIAITPDGKTAYVTNNNSNNVTPIDIAAGTAGTAIGVGSSPRGIAITPDGKTAYVVNNGSDNVTPIDIAAGTAGTAIGVGTNPWGIAITPDGKTAYVTNSGSDNVTPIDIAAGTAGTAIGVGSDPRGIAITPDGKTAYVTNSGSDNVTPIDIAAGTATTAIGVGSLPGGIAITPVQPHQSDALIRGGLASAYRGDDIYNQTGTGQTFVRQARSGFGDQFNVKIENDGSVDDSFSVHGAGSSMKFKVTYWSGPFNVTPDVVFGTFQTDVLAPGESQSLTAFIFAKRGVRSGTGMTDLVSATSDADPAFSDVVGARLVVNKNAGDFNSQLPIP